MDAAPQTSPPKKPRLALAIATCFGLGYIPKAPGTAGSLAGIAVAWAIANLHPFNWDYLRIHKAYIHPFPWLDGIATVVLAGLGVWVSGRSASYLQKGDPAQVVIDEVSGQQITYLPVTTLAFLGPNWKYLLLGFILFRVFDIWKPFPVRQAEKLPGGWGIMADDWLAGIYAALGLWVARALGM